MPDIVHELQIAAPPPAVFDAINSADGNRGYWTDQTDYEPREGAVAVFGFGPNRETTFQFRIDRINPPRQLEWTCVDGPEEWRGTSVRWRLDPAGDGATTVRFEHRGWGSADGGLGQCSFTWARVLERLDGLVSRGERAPVFAVG